LKPFQTKRSKGREKTRKGRRRRNMQEEEEEGQGELKD